jgi:hypothetical protein
VTDERTSKLQTLKNEKKKLVRLEQEEEILQGMNPWLVFAT